MKKLFLAMLAIVTIFATSCQKEVGGDNATVSFNIGTPKIATRAFSDGTTATVLQYAVYDAEGNELTDFTVTDGVIHGSTVVNFNLVTGNTYSVIFWAAAENAPYAIDFEQKTMTVDYENASCNDERRDAFYAYHTFTVTGAQTETIELKRPFAQINIGTNDYAAAKAAGYEPTKSFVKVNSVFTTFNFVDGTVSGDTTVTYDYADIVKDSFPVAGYEYLAMNYVLVAAEKTVVDVEFAHTAVDASTAKTRTVGSVPVQRNYRTNIYGKLLTSDVEINVVIVPEYEENSHNEEIISLRPINGAKGVGLNNNDDYVITSTEGLVWCSTNIEIINKSESKTIRLANDIDLTGVTTNGDSFAPIGSTGERDNRNRLVCDAFKGTFDGNGHTIKGLYQSGWDMGYEWGQYGSIGLFAELEGATVKNLTIEGMEAQVEGGDISFIAGSATGDCVFENIEIKNGSIGTYNNGIGGIIGWSGSGTYTFKNITLGSDVVLGGLWGSFDSSIGGIVGQAEPGATYNFENVTINCRIDAYNDCTASYDYYNYRMCGMIIGRCAETTAINGTNYPDLSKYNMTFNNVVVNYGDWMNYHYCRKSGERAVRVEPGFAYGGIAEDRDHSTDDIHCYQIIPFDQLIGGAQYGVKGLPTIDGVTVNYPASYNPNPEEGNE